MAIWAFDRTAKWNGGRRNEQERYHIVNSTEKGCQKVKNNASLCGVSRIVPLPAYAWHGIFSGQETSGLASSIYLPVSGRPLRIFTWTATLLGSILCSWGIMSSPPHCSLCQSPVLSVLLCISSHPYCVRSRPELGLRRHRRSHCVASIHSSLHPAMVCFRRAPSSRHPFIYRIYLWPILVAISALCSWKRSERRWPLAMYF